MKMTILWAVLVVVAGFATWVRLAPHDAARWHPDVMTAPDPGQGGILLRPGVPPGAFSVPGTEGQALLAALDAVARATPRTEVLAGSVAAGRITYVSRSRVWGFPDYTTVQIVADGRALAILGRLRFGRSDLGVNRARVEGWLEDVRARVQPG